MIADKKQSIIARLLRNNLWLAESGFRQRLEESLGKLSLDTLQSLDALVDQKCKEAADARQDIVLNTTSK